MKQNTKHTIINLIESFFITFAWFNVGDFNSTHIFMICAFCASFFLLHYKQAFLDDISNQIRNCSNLLGAVFTLGLALTTDLSGGLENRFFVIGFVLMSIIGIYLMLSNLCLFFIMMVKKKQ